MYGPLPVPAGGREAVTVHGYPALLDQDRSDHALEVTWREPGGIELTVHAKQDLSRRQLLARLGSSVGISKVHDADELEPAVALARKHDDKVLIEELLDGVEVECGVLGNREPIASQVGEIVANAEWYDYSAKYDEGGMELVVPARIPPETSERVRAVAVESFVATECEGMARVDLFVTSSGNVVVNEINTIPGFTTTSVYAKLFEASGIGYGELLDRLIELALERHERRSQLVF